MATTIVRLKVSLRHICPPVWRRVEIAADATLFNLHRALQTAMGWSDSHLHQFCHRGVYYGQSDREYGVHRENERRVRIHDVLRRPKDRLVYEYDFGDGWEHEVVLESLEEARPGMRYPRVVAGKRACPPEDVGGLGGYENFLEAIANPEHPEHQEFLEWCGGPFDPEQFDLKAANAGITPAARLVAPEQPG